MSSLGSAQATLPHRELTEPTLRALNPLHQTVASAVRLPNAAIGRGHPEHRKALLRNELTGRNPSSRALLLRLRHAISLM
jgi:hypothetical protein